MICPYAENRTLARFAEDRARCMMRNAGVRGDHRWVDGDSVNRHALRVSCHMMVACVQLLEARDSAIETQFARADPFLRQKFVPGSLLW